MDGIKLKPTLRANHKQIARKAEIAKFNKRTVPMSIEIKIFSLKYSVESLSFSDLPSAIVFAKSLIKLLRQDG